MECIKAKNAKAEKWISEIPKENWANVYFKGSRWNMLTTNAVESFNNVLKGARELPIAALVDHTRWKVQEYFHLRRKAASEWKTHLTHNAEKWLDRSCLYGSKFTPRPCSWNEYEVISSTNTDHVDLEKRTCMCGLFQIMGLPCGHAIAAMGVNKLDKYRYCQDWFLASTYRTTYEEVIHPTLDRTQWPEPSHVLEVVLPPRIRRQPGRPKKVRMERGLQFGEHHNCKSCGEPEHNKRTCKNPPLVNGQLNMTPIAPSALTENRSGVSFAPPFFA
ncbi:uncharacterized protein LOC143878882 [Tasmannia lanceolata]|uniref:uncharacterized protein LOC143878882 n=1 Tax=Tasmannia lanceolata TaxID=3420 RepID=UPI004063DA08